MKYFKIIITIAMCNFFLINKASTAINAQLFNAIKKNDLTKVTELLDQGANPNYVTAKDETSLHFASRKDLQQIVTMLLKHGANPNLQTKNDTPLTMAIKSNSKTRFATIQRLLNYGANPDLQNAQGNAALHLIAGWKYSNPCILKSMLEGKPNPFIKNGQGLTACDILVKSSQNSSDKMLSMLLSYEKHFVQSLKEQRATTCLMQEHNRYNTGIFGTIQDLLETTRHPAP